MALGRVSAIDVLNDNLLSDLIEQEFEGYFQVDMFS